MLGVLGDHRRCWPGMVSVGFERHGRRRVRGTDSRGAGEGGTKETIRSDGMNSSVMFKLRKPRRDGDERDGAEADEEEDVEEEDRGWESDGG